jgi:hypothetical protein
MHSEETGEHKEDGQVDGPPPPQPTTTSGLSVGRCRDQLYLTPPPAPPQLHPAGL